MLITPLSVSLVILQDQFLNLMTAAAVISAADFERKQNNERRLSPRRFVDRRTPSPETLLEAWNRIEPCVSSTSSHHTLGANKHLFQRIHRWTKNIYLFHIKEQSTEISYPNMKPISTQMQSIFCLSTLSQYTLTRVIVTIRMQVEQLQRCEG